jgi:ABC-type sugar transport system substrate-binding protein
MKKFLVLSVLAIMLFSSFFAFAANKTSNFVVGINYFGNAGILITLANNSKYVIEYFDGSAIMVDNNFTVDKIVTDIENLIATGVDGLVVWTPTPTLYPIISQMCLKAKVPFVLSDKVPEQQALRDQLRQNPYFVGGVAPKNEEYGIEVANYALSQGWKTCIVNTSMPGDPTDQPRFDAFKKAYEAGGGKIIDIVRSTGISGGVAEMENSLVAHPNPDFIYGVGSGYGVGAVQALEKFNYNTKVVTSGLEEQVLDYLAEGKIAMANGDYWVSGVYSAIMLQNYLDGVPLKDENGQAPIYDQVGFFNVESQQVDLFKKCFVYQPIYSKSEILQMSGKNNKDFDFEAFVKVIENYTLEDRVAQKLKEGIVTEEEVTNAGININK